MNLNSSNSNIEFDQSLVDDDVQPLPNTSSDADHATGEAPASS